MKPSITSHIQTAIYVLVKSESSVSECQHIETTTSHADDEKLLCITALNSHKFHYRGPELLASALEVSQSLVHHCGILCHMT